MCMTPEVLIKVLGNKVFETIKTIKFPTIEFQFFASKLPVVLVKN